jgi:hypothetical protein
MAREAVGSDKAKGQLDERTGSNRKPFNNRKD